MIFLDMCKFFVVFSNFCLKSSRKLEEITVKNLPRVCPLAAFRSAQMYPREPKS